MSSVLEHQGDAADSPTAEIPVAEIAAAAPKEASRLRRVADIFRRRGQRNSAEMLIWANAVCRNDPSEETVVSVLRGLIWAATRDQKR